MKHNFFLFLIATALLWTSCGSSDDGFEKSETGLQYKFLVKNEGAKPKVGDFVFLTMRWTTDQDSVIFDSELLTRMTGRPFVRQLEHPAFVGSFEEGLHMMSVGDSAVFRVSADSVFKFYLNRGLPSWLPPGSMVNVSTKLTEITTLEQFKKEKADAQSKSEEMMKTATEEINAYIQKQKLDTVGTGDGLIIANWKKSGKPVNMPGDKVFVNYKGRLLSGTSFDQGENLEVELGRGGVIQGWEEALSRMSNGDKATLIIPFWLGYGDENMGQIPPYSTLVFDIEITNVVKAK